MTRSIRITFLIALIVGLQSASAAELAVQGLSVHPPQVELVGSRATQQLIVSARTQGRTFADLTRAASYRSLDPSIVSVDGKGRIRAHGDGSTEILIEYGSVTVRSRVTVSQYHATKLVDFRTDVIASLARRTCAQRWRQSEHHWPNAGRTTQWRDASRP